jgi:endonuclease/exonuclease/phosphatase family metal-dependent hydrolase
MAFFIFWLFFTSRKYALISLVALIIGWQSIHAFFAFDIHKRFISQKSSNAFRILTWNVRGWDAFTSRKIGSSGHLPKMMDFIRLQNPDILCFQEFFEPKKVKGLSSNISFITHELNYPYYYFSADYTRFDGLYEFGVAIFSRFPIMDSLKIKYGVSDPKKSPESLLAADLDIHGKSVRIFTTHLQSVLFHGKDFRNVEIVKNVDDSVLEASMSLIKKLRIAYERRRLQAELVRDQLDKSPNPAIICGDFNDVPNSYTYFHIKGSLDDAFIKKGFGIGRTYVNISRTLRIDYILLNNQFKVLQCAKFAVPYSDHHPVIADVEIP